MTLVSNIFKKIVGAPLRGCPFFFYSHLYGGQRKKRAGTETCPYKLFPSRHSIKMHDLFDTEPDIDLDIRNYVARSSVVSQK